MTWRRRLVAACTLVAVVISCRGITSALETEARDVPQRDIITMTVDGPRSVVADGKSTIRVTARIPAEASTKTITFTTSAGFFVESSTKTLPVRASADTVTAKAAATTLLRSDTAVTAIVRATIGEFYDTVTVSFVKP